MARMARRERGVYAFLQKPSEMRLMPAKFRLLMEQGRVAEAMQPVNDALELLGYGNYMPDYRIFYADLSPQASHRMDEKERCCRRNPWLGEYIENFTSTRLLRKAERVAEHFGMEYIKEKFCPVCWVVRSVSARRRWWIRSDTSPRSRVRNSGRRYSFTILPLLMSRTGCITCLCLLYGCDTTIFGVSVQGRTLSTSTA